MQVISVQLENNGGSFPSPEDLQWWIDKYNLTYLVLGVDNNNAWSKYAINGYIPLNYVIDPSMTVAYRAEGFNKGAIISVIESLLDTMPTPTPTPNDMYTLALDGGEPSGRDGYYLDGDLFYLNLSVTPPENLDPADIYVLLAIGGSFWSYPGWLPVSSGLNHLDYAPSQTGEETLMIIPAFAVSGIPAGGPFYFYAASFEDGFLDLAHLSSNGAVLEFGFR